MNDVEVRLRAEIEEYEKERLALTAERDRLRAELAEAKERLQMLDVDKVEAWQGEMTTTIDSLKSELFWQASTLNETALKCLDLYKQRKKVEAELADCNQRLTDARGIIKKLTTVDKEYLKQKQRTEAELAILRPAYKQQAREFIAAKMDYSDEIASKEAERDKLLDALTPFAEVWEKRSGPNQPSISSEVLIAVHVKHFIHAKTLVRPECLADVLPTPTGSGEW